VATLIVESDGHGQAGDRLRGSTPDRSALEIESPGAISSPRAVPRCFTIQFEPDPSEAWHEARPRRQSSGVFRSGASEKQTPARAVLRLARTGIVLTVGAAPAARNVGTAPGWISLGNRPATLHVPADDPLDLPLARLGAAAALELRRSARLADFFKLNGAE